MLIRQRFTFILAITTFIVLSIPSQAIIRVVEGKVTKVTDGDTVTVLDSNNEQHRVRLAGIDAPEKGQPFGNASRKKLREFVSGKEVKVEYDKHDRYGHIVGAVRVGSEGSKNEEGRAVAGQEPRPAVGVQASLKEVIHSLFYLLIFLALNPSYLVNNLYGSSSVNQPVYL